jgi:hypothetical protein
MNKQWKEIKGNREIYEVSTSGDIRTKNRTGTRGKRVNGHALTQRDNSNGYLRCNMNIDGKPRSYLTHRLVAKSFISNPENKPYVNHIDGNKHNNKVDNLEWCTRSENEKHAWAIGLKKDVSTKGELHGMHKLKETDVRFIRDNHVRNGGTIKTGELAKMFSVNPQTVTDIVSNRIWKSIL